MRIAVTGATGFIGRHVLHALQAHGLEEFIVAGRRAPPADARITFVEVDLLTDSVHDWLAIHRPSHLLHLAWYAKHRCFWDSPLNRDWREATAALTRSFCEQGGQQIVVAGSCAEYDWSGEHYLIEGVTPLQPRTLYGQEKNRTREQMEEICATHGVSLAWGRVFYPFGSGEDRARLIPSVVDTLMQRYAPFPIHVGYQCDLMPVEDVARAFVHLLHRNATGVFNVCSGVPTQLGDLIEWIGEVLGRDPRPLLSEGTEDDEGPRFLVGNNKALLNTGWQPQYDLMDSLQLYVRDLAEVQPHNHNMMGGP